MGQEPEGPQTNPEPSGQQHEARRLEWQQAVLVVLAVIGVIIAIALFVMPLPWFTEPETAKATKHPPFAAGQSCSAVGCHDNFKHKIPFNGKPCETCHVIDSWAVVHYTHSWDQMNMGIHAVLGCMQCHTEGKPAPPKACQYCHKNKSPHHDPAHRECAKCHQAIGWKFIKLPPGHISLEGGHSKLTCTSCHNPITFKVPGGSKQCSNCHGPKHGFTTGCSNCHDPSRYWYVDPSTVNHSFFPFGVVHRNIDCRICHPALQFVGTDPNCASCHGANHGFNSNCTRCHSVWVNNWKVKHFNHDFYPLNGVHAAFDCAACHPTKTYSMKNPLKKGTYLPAKPHVQFVGMSPQCQRCHGVPHGYCLGTQCYRCHNTSSFQDVNFNHRSVWQYYTGAHTRLACSKCHPGGVKFCERKGTTCPACHGFQHGFTTNVCTQCHNTTSFSDVHFNHRAIWPYFYGAHSRLACTACHPGNRFNPPPDSACQNCHGYPHGSGLGNLGMGCPVCHNPTSWNDVDFNHKHWWPYYTGAHPKQACSKCHPGGIKFPQLNSGYSSNCASCHGIISPTQPHGYSSSSAASVCLRCHNTAQWWPIDFAFGHPITLGGKHEANAQAAPTGCQPPKGCHPGSNFVVAPKNCQECHVAPHGAAFNPSRCAACHTPTYWSNTTFRHPQTILGIHQSAGVDTSVCTTCHPGGNFAELGCGPCHSYTPPPYNHWTPVIPQ